MASVLRWHCPPTGTRRFFFQGGGGLNGVSHSIGPQATGDATALASGFAVVGNDSGHQGAGFDATFMEDQEALLNFLYQANATVTVIAKQMVEEYYGKAAAPQLLGGAAPRAGARR